MQSNKCNIDVSIVIVCMNNYGMLKDCIDSIYKYTNTHSFEIIVVAFFFSMENRDLLSRNYPDVIIVDSNEIRGFSANNNMGLKQARGKYCFVLNDDTYHTMPVIDRLCSDLDNNPQITLVSPQIVSPNGNIQYSGIPEIHWLQWLQILLKLRKEREDKSGQYIRYEGLFKTYNILGAAFLIRTDVFRELGFFDETYYFGPEDKALGILLNRRGYTCYVDADVKLIHLGGATGGELSPTICATLPSNRKGRVIMYSDGSKFKYAVLAIVVFLTSLIWCVSQYIRFKMGNNKYKYSYRANWNVCKTIFSRLSTTEIFKKIYKKNI